MRLGLSIFLTMDIGMLYSNISMYHKTVWFLLNSIRKGLKPSKSNQGRVIRLNGEPVHKANVDNLCQELINCVMTTVTRQSYNFHLFNHVQILANNNPGTVLQTFVIRGFAKSNSNTFLYLYKVIKATKSIKHISQIIEY